MKVFLTGATGFVGTAVAEELSRRGHSVVGLARSDGAAETLRLKGHESHRGNIAEADSIVSAFESVDAVIHAAFNHDFSQYVEHCMSDGRLLDALAKSLAGTNKPLIATSATVVTGKDDLVIEQDSAINVIPRSASEAFLEYSNHDVATGVVRLPPSVHGAGDKAFVPALIGLAREKGVSAYIDDGTNLWPTVNRLDAARLFCDVVEQPKPGARYHAVAGTGIAFHKIAEAIGVGIDVPVKSVSQDQAEDHFGWLAMFAGLNNPTSSEWTQKTANWYPRENDLFQDMTASGYFATSS